jgi:hypothetical protein
MEIYAAEPLVTKTLPSEVEIAIATFKNYK